MTSANAVLLAVTITFDDGAVELTDLRMIDDGFDLGRRQAERVDRQHTQDGVARGDAHGVQELLQALARISGQRAKHEQVVVRLLIGEDEDARLGRAAAIDRTVAKRRVRRRAERREVGPRQAGLAAHHQPRQRRLGPGVELPERMLRRLVGQVASFLRVTFVAAAGAAL